MNTSNTFFDNLQESQKKELSILFENKTSWYETYNKEQDKKVLKKEKETEIEHFNHVLFQFIQYQKNAKIINLSHIHFPDFRFKDYSINTAKKIYFNNSIFHNLADFEDIVFSNTVEFVETIFHGKTNFRISKFDTEVSFILANFNEDVNFHAAQFNSVGFGSTIFNKEASFSGVNFNELAVFHETKFNDYANFMKVKFNKEAFFNETLFNGDVSFFEAYFNEIAYFDGTKFNQIVNFYSAILKNILDFTNVSFKQINLKNIRLLDANFLSLTGYEEGNKILLNENNFSNKESARLIKNHFEKQNNIIEANKYFAIEQELYIDELHENKPPDSNRYKNLFVLYLNKYVSYFGTDWIRPLLVIFIFGFFSSFWYSFLQHGTEAINFNDPTIRGWLGFGFLYSTLVYISYHRKYWISLSLSIIVYIFIIFTEPDLRYISNEVSKLINPLNIFKPKINYFENIAIYGMMVKLGMATLIYQFIMAFRQNTRRK